MSGATAFFSVFALPAILMIIFRVFSIFINGEMLRQQLHVKLAETIGEEAVVQIVSVIRSFRALTPTFFSALIGFLFLLFVATTLFKVIKSSLNQLWDVRYHPHSKVIATLTSRLQSIGIIILLGLLFSVGIVLETVQVIANKYMTKQFPNVSFLLFKVIGLMTTLLIVALWFLIVFKYLSDARPKWSIAWIGALFTSVLFLLGRATLHALFNYNNINTVYGASTSAVLILLFVFYIAMILYYGAAFTKIWSIYKGKPINGLIG